MKRNFPQSSTRNAFSSSDDATIEVRFPAALLSVMTLALIFGGLITCGLMWFLSGSQPPSQVMTLRAVGTAILLLDIGMAIFLRKYLGSTFVRADDKGVTSRSGFGKEQFASWEQIARVETTKRGAVIGGFTLFDSNEKELLRARSNANPPLDMSKIVVVIEKKLSVRR